MKVRIKKLGGQQDTSFNKNTNLSDPSISTNRTLNSIPRKDANVEVEKGEFIVTNLSGDGIPETFKAGGQRHSNGGTPLNLPDKSFVFSDTKSMKITDKDLLKEFNQSKSATPAKIAKKYDISKYKEILLNPDADKREVETAEKMIQNYNEKLGKLALVQESMKGFENGIPEVAYPYLITMGITPEMLLPEQPMPDMSEELPMAQRGLQTGSRPPRVGLAQGLRNFGTNVGNMFRTPYIYPAAMQTTRYTNTGLDKPYTTQTTTGAPRTKNTTTIKKQEIPKDAVIKDIDATDLEPGDYVKRKDGSYAIVKGSTQKERRATYDEFKKSVENLSPEAKQKWINNTIAKMEEKDKEGNYKYFGSKALQSKRINPEKLIELAKTDPDKFINTFLKGQEQVYKAAGNAEDIAIAQGKDVKDFVEAQKTGNIDAYNKWAKKNNLPSLTPEETAIFQAMYIGSTDLVGKDEEFVDFQNRALGMGDETLGGIESSQISPIDGLPFNTTLFQKTNKLIKEKGYEFGEIPETEKVVEEEELKLDDTPNVEIGPEWWKQDLVRMGNDFANWAGVKKYLPHEIPVDLPEIDPTFYDPSRALAANAEMANVVSQGLGPQSMAERMAIQGKAASQAANIMGEYDARNVGVANQFAAQNAQMQAQEAMINNQKAEELFDQWTITNQQFDNEKRAARTALAQSYNDALTNKWQTHAFNKLYPQYAVHPSVGGMAAFTYGKNIDPSRTPRKTTKEEIQEIVNIKNEIPGITIEEILKIIGK